MNDSNASPWHALELDSYEDAIQLFSQGYMASQDLRLLSGRSLAYLAANMPNQALMDLEEVIARTERRLASQGDHAFLGICHWYLARPDSAIAQWRAGLSAPYADAAGGILLPTLLLYAGVRLGEGELEKEAQRMFRAHWQKFVRRVRCRQGKELRTPQNFADPELSSWPGAIVPFLLEKEDSSWLLHQARKTDSESLTLRRECQAQFAIAVHAMRSGNRGLFVSNMEACARNSKGSLEAEHYIARWEMLKDYPNSPFSAI